jgi:hypothetical protein
LEHHTVLFAPIRADYLRLCGAAAKLFAVKDVRPLFLYSLMNLLNDLLAHQHDVVDWTVDGATLTQTPTWARADLRKLTRKWVGTGVQLDDTIDKFISAGLLVENKQKLSITVDLVDWHLNHARGFHQEIFRRPAPETWTRLKGSWLSFNEIIFRHLYEEIGDVWRDVRDAINAAISAKKSEGRQRRSDRGYTTDHIGKHPAYWVVINMVGFAETISPWDIMKWAPEFGLRDYVKSIGEVAEAVDELVELGIVVKIKDDVQLAPEINTRMMDVLKKVEVTFPKLKSDCEAWNAAIKLT